MLWLLLPLSWSLLAVGQVEVGAFSLEHRLLAGYENRLPSRAAPPSIGGISLARTFMQDCSSSWQRPVMSIPTIQQPSRPVQCIPDRKGKNTCDVGQCQYSLKRFQYICCRDDSEVEPPVCPRYYDSLAVACSHSQQCPKGFECMDSRRDSSVKLCCRENKLLQYAEPETSFKDHLLTPQRVRLAPQHMAKVSFAGRALSLGELTDQPRLDSLSDAPSVWVDGAAEGDKESWTVLVYDTTSNVTRWLCSGLQSEGGWLRGGKRAEVSYLAPSEHDTPEGMHVLMVLVFKEATSSARINARIDDDVKGWIETNKDTLGNRPYAGTIYAYSTLKDDRLH